MNKKLALCMISAAFSFSFLYFGCGEDEQTINQQTLDTSVVIYDSIDVYEFQNQASLSGVDLLKGLTTTAADTTKDMQLLDSNLTGFNFYFRSGEFSVLGVLIPGEQTRFNNPYRDITRAQFDTLSVIPDSNPTLDSLDFTESETTAWGYFNFPLLEHPVYGFYLKGKYAEGYTANRVFGVIYLKSASSSGPGTFKVNIAVKINKAGQNKFVR